ncbi:hypothetical protein N3K66_006133 [Trichothecium roseum]|uniref:Uncharacterized protein n=1 Tax=Trichothecium roseum TaxID=47278 RepID=A0ACC0V1R2_9HYPO|nr:hypothetical protein N3K66_006133 [Trichothecium roseum]
MRVPMDGGHDARSIISSRSRTSRFREEGIGHSSSTDTLGIHLVMPGLSEPQPRASTSSARGRDGYFVGVGTGTGVSIGNGNASTCTTIREATRRADPTAGETYLIVVRNQGRALTCYNGRLSFEDETGAGKHSQWTCTWRHGFFGFRNVAEGTYLGHDVWWDFYAKVRHHRGWECFKTEKRPGGGHWLQALYFTRFYQVSAKKGGGHGGLHAEKETGTLWEFVKIS